MTPDTNMVERVARAIYEEMSDGPWCGEPSAGPDHELAFKQARATIAAMREPTEAMIGRAWDGADRGETGVRPEYAWAAMIDAALAEGEKG